MTYFSGKVMVNLIAITYNPCDALTAVTLIKIEHEDVSQIFELHIRFSRISICCESPLYPNYEYVLNDSLHPLENQINIANLVTWKEGTNIQ
jgi:hypothetical protein